MKKHDRTQQANTLFPKRGPLCWVWRHLFDCDLPAHPVGVKVSVTDPVVQHEKKAVTFEHRTQVEESVPVPLLSIATNAWRLRKRMIDPETNEPKEEVRRHFRHVEAIIEALAELDIEIKDYTGKPYDPGMALKVVAFEPTVGVESEEISETITPSVFWKGQLAQMGEIVVATPQD